MNEQNNNSLYPKGDKLSNEWFNEAIFQPVDHNKGDIKIQIASVVRYLPKYYGFHSLGTYNALLSLFNITVELYQLKNLGKASERRKIAHIIPSTLIYK